MPEENQASFYPPVAFSFLVKFAGLDGVNEGSFREISGLKVSLSVEEIREGGENGFSRKFPKPPTYQNLILKRGVLKGSPLIDWATTSFQNFAFTPKDITLHLLDESFNPLMTWNITNAYPVGLSIGEFHAEDSKVLVETLELAYESFK